MGLFRRAKPTVTNSDNLCELVLEVMTDLMGDGEPEVLGRLSRVELLLVVGAMTNMFEAILGNLAAATGQTTDQLWREVCAHLLGAVDAPRGGGS